MPASAQLTGLDERKRQLVVQADLHRQLIVMERLHLQERFSALPRQITDHRWWWIAGAAVAGWLVTRKLSGLIRWVPRLVIAARIIRNVRP